MNERGDVAAGGIRFENDWPIGEVTALRGVIEALLVTLRQCRIAIGLYGDRDGAEIPPVNEDT